MKKRKLKKRVIIFITIIVLIILIVIINPIRLYNKYQLQNLGYKESSIESILDNNLKKEVLELGYNKTIDKVLEKNDYNLKYFNNYKSIDYYELDNYTNSINKLLEKGYIIEDINNILKLANNDNFKEFVDKDYIENISSYLKYDFSKLENIDRYIKYKNNHDIEYELAVIYVNIGLDKEYYKDPTLTSKFSYDMLINKYHGVSESFIPENIVDVPNKYGNNEKLNEETLNSFIKMSNDCKASTGYQLFVNSGYRDYESQEKTYNSYLKLYGKKYTEDYVTHPGYSEHQTGLAVDIKAESNTVFANSKESKWVLENAYKYGFIIRYKKEYENITGVKYESWHYRYVGLEIAKYIHDNPMSYEEYVVRFLNK